MLHIHAKRHWNVGPRHVGEDILCAENLCFTYPDGTEALRDVTIHVARGSTLAIIGPNGAGKTTLLKILLGVLEGYQGFAEVNGMSPRDARLHGNTVSWVPQRTMIIWDFPLTVWDVVRMGLVGKSGMLRSASAEDVKYARTTMDLLEITDIADRPIGDISTGQQQRTIIARALAPRPSILMLDEPTVGVDQAGQEAFNNLIRRIRHEIGVTLVIVSHDLRSVLPECERVACLNRTLHFHDRPSHLTPELLGKVFRCDLTGLFSAHHDAVIDTDHNRCDGGDTPKGQDRQ